MRTSGRRQRPTLWVVEGLDIAELRRVVLWGGALGVTIVGGLLTWLAPGVLPPTVWSGVGVAVAALLIGFAAAVAVDAADLTVRGPRHVRAAGGELVAVVPSQATSEEAAPLARAVLDARESDERILLGLAPASGDGGAAARWTEALGEALAEQNAAVLHANLAGGRSAEPGVVEVVEDGLQLGSVAEIDEHLRLARMGPGSDLRGALAALPEIPQRLPEDLDALLVSLPAPTSVEAVAATSALNHVLVVARRDHTSRVDLIAALDALEGSGAAAQVMLVDDRTLAMLDSRQGGREAVPPDAAVPAPEEATGDVRVLAADDDVPRDQASATEQRGDEPGWVPELEVDPPQPESALQGTLRAGPSEPEPATESSFEWDVRVLSREELDRRLREIEAARAEPEPPVESNEAPLPAGEAPTGVVTPEDDTPAEPAVVTEEEPSGEEPSSEPMVSLAPEPTVDAAEDEPGPKPPLAPDLPAGFDVQVPVQEQPTDDEVAHGATPLEPEPSSRSDVGPPPPEEPADPVSPDDAISAEPDVASEEEPSEEGPSGEEPSGEEPPAEPVLSLAAEPEVVLELDAPEEMPEPALEPRPRSEEDGSSGPEEAFEPEPLFDPDSRPMPEDPPPASSSFTSNRDAQHVEPRDREVLDGAAIARAELEADAFERDEPPFPPFAEPDRDDRARRWSPTPPPPPFSTPRAERPRHRDDVTTGETPTQPPSLPARYAEPTFIAPEEAEGGEQDPLTTTAQLTLLAEDIEDRRSEP